MGRLHSGHARPDDSQNGDQEVNTPRVCAHFESRTEFLSLELTVAILPLKRCLLAERMVSLLSETDSADSANELLLEPESGKLYCRCGPDYGPIHRSLCTPDRFEASCLPAYEEILVSAGLDDSGVRTQEEAE